MPWKKFTERKKVRRIYRKKALDLALSKAEMDKAVRELLSAKRHSPITQELVEKKAKEHGIPAGLLFDLLKERRINV